MEYNIAVKKVVFRSVNFFKWLMSLIKWEPFENLDRFFEDFSRFPQQFSSDLAVDVYEEGNNVVAKMSVPGVDPEKIDVSIQDGFLHIAGSREEEKENEQKNYYSREIRRGSFERAVRLPQAVDEENVSAEYEKGTLVVTMPKRAGEERGKIPVNVKEK